jgi:UDP-4-amino-4-deoxy-L-arabinose-oxoglutarate aminotransferase
VSNTREVEFFRHDLGEAELESVRNVFETPFLTTGEFTDKFERRLAEYLGVEYVIGCMSGTAGLHLAYLALEIGPGDEVITTPMSFIATATAIVHAGARPVFVDVETETGNIDPAAVESAITSKTRAISPVHLYGQLCDMKKLQEITDRHGIAIVEDAAHSLEAEQDGYRSGSFGDAAAFSFYATKSITCGEGGCITVHRGDLAEKLRKLSLHGMSKGAAEGYGGLYRHWDMELDGWKYNLSNILAAILLPQLNRTEAKRNRREEICRLYEEGFSEMDGIGFPRVLDGRKSARHLFTIWVPKSKRDAYIESLGREGVGVAVNYRPIHLMEYFRETFGYREGMYPVAEKIGASTISLPLHTSLKTQEIEYVIEKVKEVGLKLGVHG